MKNLLSEELERYRRLSNYNPKLTLTENVSILSEAPFNPATTVKELESALGKGLGAIAKEFKIVNMDAAAITKLLEMDAKSFEKELAKSFAKDIKAGGVKGELGAIGKEISKIDLLRRISNETKSKGRSLTAKEMELLISETKNANKLKAAKFQAPTPRNPKPNPNDAKIGDDIIVSNPEVKKMNWKSLVKWGAVGAVSTGVLYYIYKKTHGEEPPVVTSGPTPDPTPTPLPVINRYRTDCTGTYTQGCKSEAIKPVQTCLGLVPDGKFWVKTQAALVEKGFPNGFTDADVSKICGNQTPPPPQPEDEYEDAEGQEADNMIDN
jgi:hypothetical protein